ncbi:phosphodiester glycosidase family protein [Paenibacillus sp. FSL K6-2859]|uniref:phosphodiester glycosidase family protein n=1 Tax=Paenibacillus sp. FSL K6-2859 TaxID=2921482 RepID=UPI0030FB32F8
MRRYLRQINMAVIFVLLISLLQPGVFVHASISDLPATNYGTVIDVRQTELAPGAMYTWMDLQNERGLQKIHAVEFNPGQGHLELRAGKKDGKVYGMKGVTEMAAYADSPGNRVIAGINGDFYEISGFATGVPNGLFMDDGVILNSSISAFTFGLKEDGSSIYGVPKLTKNVTINGKTTNLTSINRYRNTNELVLYTEDYNTTTKSTNEGDEVVLDIVEGEVKSGQTLKLKVSEIRNNQGNTPLTKGKVVLSANGTSRAVLQGLSVGDNVTATFALSGEWNDVKVAIGGEGPLVKDGIVQQGVGPLGIHPRTAIGTKADGSLVLFEVDGRSPGFSEGVDTDELGYILKDMGVVNAMNLDGGGSSTFVARMPGAPGVKMMNQGSDGYERKTGNGLLVVNTAPEQFTASKLVVQPNAERILQGSSLMFKAAGVDENGHPAPYSGTLNWQVDANLGTVDANGVFTAGTTAGIGTVIVEAGAVKGSGEIEVVDKLTDLSFPDEIKTYSSGAAAQLTVKALRNGQVIQADNHSFEWRVEGEIGTVDEKGLFQATSENGKNGKIYAKYGDAQTSFEVNVGLPPVMLEDFENGIDKYIASSAAANSVTIQEVTDQDFVRNGAKALKLEYDFVNKTGTSGAYLAAGSTANRIQIPGYPEKISMWIYGDGKKHWLRGQIRDGNNAAVPVDFTDQVNGVNWTGWKYVEVSVPKGKATPLTMDMPVRYMETSNLNKSAGAIYVDDIRAIYGPIEEDRTPPVLKDAYPGVNEIVKTASPTLSVNGEDDGYDPVVHPGTTLIDPDKTRVYVDDQLVEHGFYPPKGQITYKPKVPLTEGRHKVKVAIRDLSGNQTIKEWYFTVNLGSPFYVYKTPEVVYAGNTYTLDVTAEKAGKLKEGNLTFAFNPAAVKDLQVIRGDKVSETQIESIIDPALGTVRLNLTNINSSNLGDMDLIGQIQYTVRNDYAGPFTQEQLAGDTSKPFVIENTSGSVTSTEGTGVPISFIGAAVESVVKTQLMLTWNHYDLAKGFDASFAVKDLNGSVVEGAKLLFDGLEVQGATSGGSGTLTTGFVTSAEGTFKLQAVKGNTYSPVMTFKVASYDGTAAPRNVNVTMGQDAATSRQFTWQTEPLTVNTVVELVKKAEFTSFQAANVTKITGSSSIYNTNNDGTMRVHKAEAVGLIPGTEYVYRVGDNELNVSEQGSFVTSGGEDTSTKFLFIGDSQADSKAGFGLWGNTIEAAFAYMPDAEMLVHAGDMVDKGFEQEQWNWWFDAAQKQLMNTTLVPIIGNHEVMGTNGDGDYLAQFNNPQNGAASVKGTNYSFDIQDTHFVVMNTEHSGAPYTEQAEWLDQDLSATDKKWKVIFFHQGPYGSIYSNEQVQAKWVPVFDKHNVDLVMNGHDHIYLRTFPMKDGKQVAEGEGTRYVIGGSSGPKFYALTPRFWQEKIYDEDEQIYTAVEIGKNEITVTARTVDGVEIDRLVIGNFVPKSITLDQTAIELEPGASLQLQAKVVPDEANHLIKLWSIVPERAESVVTVDGNGLVTALKPGTAKVRVTVAGYPNIFAESKITVDVLQAIKLQGKGQLKPAEADQTVTEAVYASGKRIPILDGLQYSSSNEHIATTNEQGLVQAHQEGSTVISVTYREFASEYSLVVTNDEAPILTEITIKGPDSLEQGNKGSVVVQAVYSDGSKQELVEGVRYDTSDHSIAMISENGELHAWSAGITKVSAVYKGFSTEYILTVTESTPGTRPTPSPEPTPERTAEPTPSPEPTPGGWVPGPAVTPKPTATPTLTPSASAQAGVVTITASQLSENKNAQGEVVVSVAGSVTELLLPGNAAELHGRAPLRVVMQDLSVTIPASVMTDLSKLVSAEALAKSTISLRLNTLASNTAVDLLDRAGTLAGAQLRAKSDLREWSLSILTENGQSFSLRQFAEPITISFKVGANVEQSLLGIYFMDDAGKLEYMSSTWMNGYLSAAVSHFSKYVVLEYEKTFNDLKSDHWAYFTVKQLAAKQLIQGVAVDRFDPNRAVTRAEFTAMLVRALGLKGQAEAGFTDVSADKWYAEAVGLAKQAGIVNGQTALLFEPDARISRQEMAAMLARAYAYAKNSVSVASLNVSAFNDIDTAPQWAQEAISEVYRLGLMQGRAIAQFAPKQNGTRAESAQMILNLLRVME